MSGYLVPEEIIHEILLWLPAKSLLRFSTVCKSWSSMINHPSFIDTHLKRRNQHNLQNDILHLLTSKRKDRMSYSSCLIKDGEYMYTNLMLPSLLVKGMGLLSLIGTCNGLLCFAYNREPNSPGAPPTIIFNPSIRKIVILPKPSIICDPFTQYEQPHSFGYDARTNDYKVLRLVLKFQTPYAVEVYSLATNSWKRLSSAAIPAYVWSKYGFLSVNNALYWIQYRNVKREEYVIVSFDLATEMFSQIMMPEDLGRKSNRYLDLSRYGESLSLIVAAENIEIWVMKEVGVMESWKQVLTINCSKNPLLKIPNSSGEVLFKTRESPRKMQRLNYKTEQAEDFGKDKNYNPRDSFADSLVLLGQTNAVPY
ncbi:hypothetical protein ACLB2K_044272 [Fragaria x ananassa]